MNHLTCPECGSDKLVVEWLGPPVPLSQGANQPAIFRCQTCHSKTAGRATHPLANRRPGTPSWMEKLNR